MQIHTNHKRATTPSRPHTPFFTRPLPRRKPQPEGLTREQLRQIVLEQLG